MKRQLGFLALWLAISLTAAADEPWTLERALDYAQTHNPDARIARQRIAAAQAGLEQANSTFWPKLQVQSSYTRTDNPMMVFGSILNQRAYNYSSPPNFNNLPDVDDLNAQGVVTLPLYAGGRNVAGQKAAKADAEAAKQDSAAIRNALGFEVSRAFYTVLKTRQFIQAAEAAVNSFATNLDVAQKRLAGGTLLKSDVLDIEVRLAQSRETSFSPTMPTRWPNARCAICWASRTANSPWPTPRPPSARRTRKIFRNDRNSPLPVNVNARRKRRFAEARAATSRVSVSSAAWIMITAG